MTGDEMAAIRERLGASRVQFAALLGYANSASRYHVIKDYESGKVIPDYIATAARAADVGTLADFIRSYRGKDDIAEFAHQLSKHLRGLQ